MLAILGELPLVETGVLVPSQKEDRLFDGVAASAELEDFVWSYQLERMEHRVKRFARYWILKLFGD